MADVPPDAPDTPAPTSPAGPPPRSAILRVPDATVARLPVYLRALAALAEDGITTISSETLAGRLAMTSAKVRKDLSHLGTWGTRGVGYDVGELSRHIRRELGITDDRAVVIVGIGNLGRALAGYSGFASRGFRIAALVDADQQRQGEMVHGLRIRPYDAIVDLVREECVSIGVIATPPEAAQDVADAMIASGITGILNFAPIVLDVPPGVDVRRVDLSVELQILSFHEQRKVSAIPVRKAAQVETA
jgi:redox-sensing transcriptional repressor